MGMGMMAPPPVSTTNMYNVVDHAVCLYVDHFSIMVFVLYIQEV